MGPRVITIVFPGSGRAAHRKDQARPLASIIQVGPVLFQILGGTPV